MEETKKPKKKMKKGLKVALIVLLVIVLLLVIAATAGYFYLRNRFGGGAASVNLTADADTVLSVTGGQYRWHGQRGVCLPRRSLRNSH